jgi:hypothetical protein
MDNGMDRWKDGQTNRNMEGLVDMRIVGNIEGWI